MMLLLLLTGCTQNVFFPPDLWAWDSADTGRFARGEQVGVGACDDEQSAWTWTARSEGWVDSGTLHLFRLADDAVEEHPMTLVATDPGGDWDELMAGPLAAGASPAQQTAGESTRFSCDLDADRLTAVVRFHDADENLLDCLVWGESPEIGVARIRNIDPQVSAIGGCRILNE